MSKTIELRKVIQAQLKTVADRVYFETAPDNAAFPYVVYDLQSVDFGNYPRNDAILTIDVWDKNSNTTVIENLTDSIENVLDHLNNPNNAILPTFYCYYKQNLIDEDKTIKRRQLKIQVQNYERS